MDQLRIVGSKNPLRGTVEVSGSKNAALPILISSLLTSEKCEYSRVPVLQDIRTTFALLSQLGVTVSDRLSQNQVSLEARDSSGLQEAPYDVVRKMRASVLVLGPLLARFGYAKVSLPGGCAIGARPIQYHLQGFEKLGAKIELEQGYVIARAEKLVGAHYAFPFPSVGATENLLMAATLAEGETILENCAREPEIVDLAAALRAMGAEISGEGTGTIRVVGRSSLHGCKYSIMGDRIEAGTYLTAGFATGGDVEVVGLHSHHLESVLQKFEMAGAKIDRLPNGIRLRATGMVRPRATDLTTEPFPGFPTDMQAQFMGLMCIAEGESVISETIFENRFMHVPELVRFGADIEIRGNTAHVHGKPRLIAAPVMATDLRASASLIIAALVAEGETVISRIYHLDRGYERLEGKFQLLGAEVKRVKSD